MLCFLDSECLKTKHSPVPAEPVLHPKRTAQPSDHIFTTSPISNIFKKPIFKVKTPNNSGQPSETSNHIENKENQQNTRPQNEAEAAGLQQEASDSSKEIKGEPHTLEPSTVTTPPICESEPPSAANPDEEEEEEEDQTIFYTPELFEGDGSEGGLQEDTAPESPPRMASPVVLSEELFERAQGQGRAPPPDGETALSVIEEGRREGEGRMEGEDGEEVETGSSQTVSRLHRLSRSRQKAPPTLTGN